MSRERAICKRCHRLRAVNEIRYCAPCEAALRDDERPKRTPPGEGDTPRPATRPETRTRDLLAPEKCDHKVSR